MLTFDVFWSVLLPAPGEPRSSGTRATFNKLSVKELRIRAGSGRMKKAELVNALCKR